MASGAGAVADHARSPCCFSLAMKGRKISSTIAWYQMLLQTRERGNSGGRRGGLGGSLKGGQERRLLEHKHVAGALLGANHGMAESIRPG